MASAACSPAAPAPSNPIRRPAPVHAGDRSPPSGQGIARRYDYDRGGQLLEIADARRGRLRYDYDPIGRLLGAHTRDRSETFAFDPAHNLTDPQARETDPRTRTVKTRYTQQEWAALVKANLDNPRFNPLQADPWSPQDGVCQRTCRVTSSCQL